MLFRGIYSVLVENREFKWKIIVINYMDIQLYDFCKIFFVKFQMLRIYEFCGKRDWGKDIKWWY